MEERINNQSWVRLPLCLLADERLTRADIIIVAILIDKTDAKGFVKISLEKLAKLSGVSKKTVQRATQRLQDYGYIYWDRTGRESIYQMCKQLIPHKQRKKSKDTFSSAPIDEYEAFINNY